MPSPSTTGSQFSASSGDSPSGSDTEASLPHRRKSRKRHNAEHKSEYLQKLSRCEQAEVPAPMAVDQWPAECIVTRRTAGIDSWLTIEIPASVLDNARGSTANLRASSRTTTYRKTQQSDSHRPGTQGVRLSEKEDQLLQELKER